MAVVGEAHILVRAVTTHVRKDIRDGFKGLHGQATDQGADYGKAFNKGLSAEMQHAATAFTSLTRKSYVMQSGFGALLGSVSALAGGLGALAGASLSAASSFGVMANLMVQMKIASGVGKMAFHGIANAVTSAATSSGAARKTLKELREEMENLAFAAEDAALAEEDAALKLEKARETLARVQNLPPDNRARREAELAYKQAELSYRKAKDKAEDAQDAINNPKRNRGTGAQDPFKDLTKTQKMFAMYLVENRYRMKQLREAAASGFLPVLKQQMEQLFRTGTFEKIVTGISQVGKALGDATKNFASEAFSGDAVANLVQLFGQASGNIRAFGSIIGKVFRGFLTYLSATAPLMNRFVAFLNFRSGKFADGMKTNYSSTMAFFKMAGDNAAKFGTIFSNIWIRIKSFIANTTGPGSGGEYLLNWIKEASGNFLKFDQGIRNFAARNYFRETAETTKIIFQTVGGIVKEFAKLGTNKGTREFWLTLQKGTNNLGTLFQNMVTSGTGLAKILNYVLEGITALADSGQVLAFFSALEIAFRGISNFLVTMKPFFDQVGPLLGYAAAIGFISKSMLFMGKVMGGLLLNGLKPLLIMLRFFPLTAGLAGKAMVALGIESKLAGVSMVTTTTAIGGTSKAIQGLEATSVVASRGITAAIFSIPIVGWAAAAVAALAAVGTIMSNISAAAAEKNMEQTVGLAKSGADAATLWKSSISSMATDKQTMSNIFMGGTVFGKGMDDSTESIKKQTGALKAYQDWNKNGWGGVLTTWDAVAFGVGYLGRALGISNDWGMELVASQNVAGGFERMGQSLQVIMDRDGMPGVIAATKEWQRTSKLTNDEMATGLNEMDGFKQSLIDQADAMGVVIRNGEGVVDNLKLIEFAEGGTAYQTAMAAQAQREFNSMIADAVNSFIDLQGPLNQNFDDVKKWAQGMAASTKKSTDSWKDYFNETSQKNIKKNGFDLTVYLAQLQSQVTEAAKYGSNLRAVYTRMSKVAGGEAAFKALAGMGKQGAGLTASLVNATDAQLQQAVSGLAATVSNQNIGAQVASAFDLATVKAAVMKKAGKYGDGLYEAMAGLTAPEIMDKYGIQFSDLLSASLSDKPAEVTAQWKEGTIAGLKQAMSNEFNSSPVYITTTKPAKNKAGGFIGLMNGGLPRFAPGGVSGPQGPRSDNILSWLSSGEYVINAASTYRYRPLLDAINSGSIDRMQNTGDLSTGGNGNNISIAVHAAPGMDEQQVATLVAQKLNSALNMGARI